MDNKNTYCELQITRINRKSLFENTLLQHFIWRNMIKIHFLRLGIYCLKFLCSERVDQGGERDVTYIMIGIIPLSSPAAEHLWKNLEISPPYDRQTIDFAKNALSQFTASYKNIWYLDYQTISF